ncbi:hypothetical protein H310_05309 [Aphanomyces invadans]|uniref:Macro domain-containing protein n=1 Tax=Aphanomyces invadans TaxID=157072 RepID=A0A024UAC4_9STRA|nr:hypothetical protein H310_05309 [Aphanomyces invadans]ETW02827.1 hypothetical protein H310_05309 [Aphanomyces invadans]|eukprot:XP_008868211.1 hypothetical protein H310_05309 [Aphanomyces invadans]
MKMESRKVMAVRIKQISSHRLSGKALRIMIYHTPDVVNEPPPCDVLVNPCNEGMTGTSLFSYFPRGGPVPAQPPPNMTHQSLNWGGMDAGDKMLYPVQTIDGLVCLAGGHELQKLLDGIKGPIKCPTGSAVFTKAPGTLSKRFQGIVHTATPFYLALDWEYKLASCYIESLNLAFTAGPFLSIATPLLGAGCKGIPVPDAVRLAGHACRKWDAMSTPRIPPLDLIFGVQDPAIGELISAEFDA